MLTRSRNGERNLCCVEKTLKIDEINPKIDLNDPYIWWKTFFVEMEVGLMEVVRSVNRSWIMTLSSAYTELFILGKSSRGRKCPGEMSGYHLNERRLKSKAETRLQLMTPTDHFLETKQWATLTRRSFETLRISLDLQ